MRLMISFSMAVRLPFLCQISFFIIPFTLRDFNALCSASGYNKTPPRLLSQSQRGFIISVHDLDRNFFALSLGDGPHKDADLFYDPALPADNLALSPSATRTS